MFVRWKTRAHWRTRYEWSVDSRSGKNSCRPTQYNDKDFSAVLVHSERVDGKPRQKIIAYLGHIKEKYVGVPTRQEYFWKTIDSRLDAIPLSPMDRQRIEGQLGQRVARPTPEALARVQQGFAALRAALKRV